MDIRFVLVLLNLIVAICCTINLILFNKWYKPNKIKKKEEER